MLTSTQRLACSNSCCRCPCTHVCCKRTCHGCCVRCDVCPSSRSLEEDSGITLEFDRLRGLLCNSSFKLNSSHDNTSKLDGSGCVFDCSRLDVVSESDSQISSCSSASCSSTSCSSASCGGRVPCTGRAPCTARVPCVGRAPSLRARGAPASDFANPLQGRNQLTLPVSTDSSRSLSRCSSAASLSSVGSVSASGGLRALHAVLGEILETGFYHEGMSQHEAKQALQNLPEGTFLIRDSSDSRYIMSISVATPQGVTSVRVAGKPGNYFLDCHESLRRRFPSFQSPLQLVAYFMNLSVCPNQCVWLDSSGRKHSAMKLLYPLYTFTPSLQALAHLANQRHEIQGLVDLAPS